MISTNSWRPFLYDSGTLTTFGWVGRAMGLNNAGHTVGWTRFPKGTSFIQAGFVYAGEVLTQIVTPSI